MKKITPTYIFLGLILLLFCIGASPFGCKSKLIGKVSDTDGNLIEGVTITTLPISYTATTNSAGEYQINDMAAGDYTVKASKQGYFNATKNVSVSGVDTFSCRDSEIRADIILFNTQDVVFQNITQRDMGGNLISDDPDDWKDINGIMTDIKCYPNPFNPTRSLTIIVSSAVTTTQITIEIYKTPSDKVRTFTRNITPGPVYIPWDGTDDNGNLLDAMIYRCYIKTGSSETYGDIQITQ